MMQTASQPDPPILLLALDRLNAQSATRSHREDRHVVLAEDDASLRGLLGKRLRDGGYRVTECSDGVELLHAFADLVERDGVSDVDLVISDVRMPGLTGMEVLEGLRGLGYLAPVLLITAFGSDEVHAEAERLGATATMNKPFDIDLLLTEVAKLT